MTITETAQVGASRSSRWLLLGSLALNLFFIGVGIAMAVRSPSGPPPERNVFTLADRIATRLPAQDATVLRNSINANRQALDNVQASYNSARDSARDALRREPFSIDDLRAAMARTRDARQGFDQTVQGAFADAAAKMSPAGRQALAAWPRSRDSRSSSQ